MVGEIEQYEQEIAHLKGVIQSFADDYFNTDDEGLYIGQGSQAINGALGLYPQKEY